MFALVPLAPRPILAIAQVCAEAEFGWQISVGAEAVATHQLRITLVDAGNPASLLNLTLTSQGLVTLPLVPGFGSTVGEAFRVTGRRLSIVSSSLNSAADFIRGGVLGAIYCLHDHHWQPAAEEWEITRRGSIVWLKLYHRFFFLLSLRIAFLVTCSGRPSSAHHG